MARTPPLGSNPARAPGAPPRPGVGPGKGTTDDPPMSVGRGGTVRPPASGEAPPTPFQAIQGVRAETSGAVPARTMTRAGTLMNKGAQLGTAPTISPTPSPVSDLRTSAPATSTLDAPASLRGPVPSGPDESIKPKFCPECLAQYPVEFRVCPKDATELMDVEPSETDEFIGRTISDTYAIVRSIGEGGMGRVYEARHTRIGKRFALKMLHPEYARQPEVLSRFQREAEAAASIQSPHVGDVYDVGKTADGRPFIVGELLVGRELAEFLAERGTVEIPFAIRVVRQICKALAAAHGLGIVHRDMKPENVFLTGDLSSPTVKVIDFGISKVGEAGGGQSLTKTGMIMGTPAYMPPEQARGERVDHRADIYSVGAILYQLLTGKRPFDRGDPMATITAVLLEDPERPCVLNPQVPASLEMVVQRAMAKSPDDRYASMASFEADLASLAVSGKTSLAPPSSSATAGDDRQTALGAGRPSDVAQSRPMIALMGGLAAFFVLGAVISVSGAVIRLSRDSDRNSNVTGSEAALLILFLGIAMVTPIGFAVHHVRKTVWRNSAKTLVLAALLRRLVVTGFVTYGVATLAIRVNEVVILRHAVGVAWPVWDLVLVILAGGAAAASHYLNSERQKR